MLRATALEPPLAAQCKVDEPDGSGMAAPPRSRYRREAPRCRSSCTQLSWPKNAATMRGVTPPLAKTSTQLHINTCYLSEGSSQVSISSGNEEFGLSTHHAHQKFVKCVVCSENAAVCENEICVP